MSPEAKAAAALARKQATKAQEAAGLVCPSGDPTQCRILDSIEDLGGGRRVLQSNCSTCGNGCARQLAPGETPTLRTGALYAPSPKDRPPSDAPPIDEETIVVDVEPEPEPPPKRKKAGK
jgi:hypothetical protein